MMGLRRDDDERCSSRSQIIENKPNKVVDNLSKVCYRLFDVLGVYPSTMEVTTKGNVTKAVRVANFYGLEFCKC